MKQLTLADEIVVLMLGDDTAEITKDSAKIANIAIAGGILMELSLLGRIDTDLESLFVVDPTPVGDDLLDRALKDIAALPGRRPSPWWIERLSAQNPDFLDIVLERLVQAGILRIENRRYFWVFSRRSYPQNTGREEREAKARLTSLIQSNDVPEPRDTLLLALAEATGVLGSILSPEERRKAESRIADVVALEEIGRSVRAVASDLRETLAAMTNVRSW